MTFTRFCIIGSAIIYGLARTKQLGTYNFVVNNYEHNNLLCSADWINLIKIVSISDPVVVKGLFWDEIRDGHLVIFRSFRPIKLCESNLHSRTLLFGR